MDHFIGVWWSGAEPDVLPAGAGADGYKAINFTGVGEDYPFYADLKKYVIDAGKGAGDGSASARCSTIAASTRRCWQQRPRAPHRRLPGTPQITPTQMRDGMEALDIDEARLEELGMTGFGPAIDVTCANHEGPGVGLMTQWDATDQKWVQLTDFIEAGQA